MGAAIVIISIGVMATGMALGPFIVQASRELKELEKHIDNKLRK